MKKNLISMPSAWGRSVEHSHYANSSKSLVVVFPGNNYSCDRSLLYFAGKSALESGHDLLLLEYGYQSARTGIDMGNQADLNIVAYECKHAVDQIKDQYEQLIFVSKSIGTVIAGQVGEILGERVVRQLFLTPLPRTVPYIRNVPCMVVYETADPVFEAKEAEAVSGLEHVRIYPLEGANHSLELGTVQESVRLLGQISEWYAEFFAKENL